MRRVDDVGIMAADMAFPTRFVEQSSLEQADGAGEGKYTIGLGQERMAFCDDSEDMASMAMTAVSDLLERFGVSPKDIGRLEVGTETITDKSKAVKTSLMPLFAAHGNEEVRGPARAHKARAAPLMQAPCARVRARRRSRGWT